MNRREIEKHLDDYGDNRQAAQKFLAAVIHDVWKKRGADVKVSVATTAVPTYHGALTYELRSPTLNGKPR